MVWTFKWLTVSNTAKLLTGKILTISKPSFNFPVDAHEVLDIMRVLFHQEASQRTVHSNFGMFDLALSGLMFSAGRRPAAMVRFPARSAMRALKPEFQSQTAAAQKLCHMSSKVKSLTDFKSELLSCLNFAVARTTVATMPAASFDFASGDSSGPRFRSDPRPVERVHIRCFKCGKMEERPLQFQACPCKQVVYCSRECHERDWQRHKNVCSHVAKKKATKPATLSEEGTEKVE